MILTNGLPFGFNSRAAWLVGVQSTAVDRLMLDCEPVNSSPDLQVCSSVLRRPLYSAHRCSDRGAWVLKCWTPTTPPTPGANVAPSGGGGSSSAGYFAAVLEGLHSPLIVCLSFRPSEHVMSPLARVCFFFLSAFLAAGGSHTSHLAMHCCLVPGRLSCTRACARANLHSKFHVFSLLISSR